MRWTLKCRVEFVRLVKRSAIGGQSFTQIYSTMLWWSGVVVARWSRSTKSGATSGPVSTGMGHRVRVRYATSHLSQLSLAKLSWVGARVVCSEISGNFPRYVANCAFLNSTYYCEILSCYSAHLTLVIVPLPPALPFLARVFVIVRYCERRFCPFVGLSVRLSHPRTTPKRFKISKRVCIMR